MTSQGAILSRMASDVRAGEEVIMAKKLGSLGVPIIMTPYNNMELEGPDIVIVNDNLAFIGIGLRTNIEAANYVKTILNNIGIEEVIIVETTFGCGHLDGVLNILNKDNAVVVPRRISYEVYRNLIRHGINVIALDAIDEVDNNMSINFVSLGNNKVVINKGSKESMKHYRNVGIECVEVDVSELMKGGGSVHCMTGVIRRG